MSIVTLGLSLRSRDTRPVRRTRANQFADAVVIGSCVIAPLNLLLVRSLTVYDLLVAAAFAELWRSRRLTMPPNTYQILAFCFVLTAVVSTFRATYAIEALTQVLQYGFIFFIQVPAVISVVKSRRAVLLCLIMLAVGSLGAILLAYVSHDTQGSGRALVFYSDNPNRLGYPVAYLAPLLLLFWKMSARLSFATLLMSRLMILVSTYLCLWALSASGSRSSLLGAIVAVIVFLAIEPGRTVAGRVLRILIVFGIAAVAIWVMIVTQNLPATLEDRIARSFVAEDRATLVADREHLANAAVHAFVEFPYLGTGLDNFRYVAVDFDLDATAQLPHNVWLQLLVQVGVVGTAAFAVLFVVWVRDLLRVRRVVPLAEAYLVNTHLCAIAGLLTIFMFAPEMLDRHYWLLFSLGVAVFMGLRGNLESRRSP
ncbi:MAG TPA: O-antigen ligase family protein [Nocardioidaceae bacterium]|nr:O-antigen ligase family protein [Nocardioidaceae bacterium]